MEIKQGDKVRVSNRVPRIYERFGSMIAPHYECKVVEIDDGMALCDSIPAKHIFLFPLKYLVKVDAEAFRLSDVVSDAGLHQDNYLNEDKKEPKFKVGDRVRVKGCGYESNLHKGDIGEILDTNDKEQCFVLFKNHKRGFMPIALNPTPSQRSRLRRRRSPMSSQSKFPWELNSRTAIGTHTPPTSPKR